MLFWLSLLPFHICFLLKLNEYSDRNNCKWPLNLAKCRCWSGNIDVNKHSRWRRPCMLTAIELSNSNTAYSLVTVYITLFLSLRDAPEAGKASEPSGSVQLTCVKY